MVTAVVQAIENREAMTLEWRAGRVTFGGNRRVLEKSRWRGFGLQRDGPVDHSLPVGTAMETFALCGHTVSVTVPPLAHVILSAVTGLVMRMNGLRNRSKVLRH